MLVNHTFESIGETKLYSIPNLIWMQFTGLKDKNGKEIYEGDIVTIPEHYEEDYLYPDEIGEVYYKEGEFSISGKRCEYISLFNFVYNWRGEVIGNIYENPELLED